MAEQRVWMSVVDDVDQHERLTAAHIRQWCDQACIKRYLVACDYNEHEATQRLRNTIRWRGTSLPHLVGPLNVWRFLQQPVMYDNGYDLQGRCVVYVRLQFDENLAPLQDKIDFVVFVVERCVRRMKVRTGQGSLTFVVDGNGFAATPERREAMRAIANIMRTHYPGVLGRLLIVNATHELSDMLVAEVVSSMDHVTRQRVVMIPNEPLARLNALTQYIDMSMIEAEYGGKSTEKFDYAARFQAMEREHREYEEAVRTAAAAGVPKTMNLVPLSSQLVDTDRGAVLGSEGRFVSDIPPSSASTIPTHPDMTSRGGPMPPTVRLGMGFGNSAVMLQTPDLNSKTLVPTPVYNPSTSIARTTAVPNVLNPPDPLAMLAAEIASTPIRSVPPPRNQPLVLAQLPSLVDMPSWKDLRHQRMPQLGDDGQLIVPPTDHDHHHDGRHDGHASLSLLSSSSSSNNYNTRPLAVINGPRVDEREMPRIPRSVARSQTANVDGPRGYGLDPAAPAAPYQTASWRVPAKPWQMGVVSQPLGLDWEEVRAKAVRPTQNQDALAGKGPWPLFVL